MRLLYDQSAPKKSANLSINGDLLQKAKALDVNLSQAFEQTLEEIVKQKKRQQWSAENAKALDAYNKYAEKHGTFSDGLRKF